MNKVKDNAQRAKNVTIGFYILAGAYFISLVSDFLEYRLLSKGFFSYAEADTNDSRQAVVGLLVFGASLAVIIMFIQWFRRAYHNLHKAGIRGLVASEGWAAGAWFVPIMNLFRPYQIMKEIWIHTKAYVVQNGSAEDEESETGSSSSVQLVGLWWTFWIISSISANISTNIARNADLISEFKNANILSIISTLTGLVGIYLIIKIIKESQLEQDRFLEAWDREAESDNSGVFNVSDSDEILD